MSRPVNYNLDALHPSIRTKIRWGQVQIWVWKSWFHLTFWTPSLDQAWKEVFTDEAFRITTHDVWTKHLQYRSKGTSISSFQR